MREGKTLKVLGINGSPRKDGNTSVFINFAFQELEKEGIETELLQLSGTRIQGCIACYKCFKNKDRRCAVDSDPANEFIEKMIRADGIILGSPTYVWDVTAEMKALIDRAAFVSIANGDMFQGKVGAAVSVMRRSGGAHTVDTMNHFFLGRKMFIPGMALGVGRNRGEVEKDEEGVQAVKSLGQRMAFLIKKLNQ